MFIIYFHSGTAGAAGDGLTGRKKMALHPDQRQCAMCGYTADGKFEGDICPQCGLTYWKCAECGFYFTAAKPPDTCPECGAKCEFLNATCYTPDCGGPGNIDPRI